MSSPDLCWTVVFFWHSLTLLTLVEAWDNSVMLIAMILEQKRNRTIRSNVKDFFFFFELAMSYSNNSHVLTCRLSTWGLDILQFSKIVAWTAQHGKQVRWLCYSHIYVYFYLIVTFTIWRWIRKSCKQHRGHWHTMRSWGKPWSSMVTSLTSWGPFSHTSLGFDEYMDSWYREREENSLKDLVCKYASMGGFSL